VHPTVDSQAAVMQQALAQGEDGSKLPVLVESQTLQTDVSIVTPGGTSGVSFFSVLLIAAFYENEKCMLFTRLNRIVALMLVACCQHRHQVVRTTFWVLLMYLEVNGS
jgi:hypothetical protein